MGDIRDRGSLGSPLIAEEGLKGGADGGGHAGDLRTRICDESKKLWHIVGPEVLCRISSSTMNLVTQAFAGHLGDVELASFYIANNVIVGFNYGLLLGMASALETLCGQAFGARRYHMLGIYMQRSWIVLVLFSLLLLPVYMYATTILKFLGQADNVAEMAGHICLWLIPLHFSFAFLFPLQRFLQTQLKTAPVAYVSLTGLAMHSVLSWVLVYRLKLGVVGLAIGLNVSWWCLVFGCFAYVAFGGCPSSWTGFSTEAFSSLWEFLTLSAASGLMLCLENWYYRILILMSGSMSNAAVAVDALSICLTANAWEMMIALAFFAGTGVRVANELGAGRGDAAKFATQVSVTTSAIIGLFFAVLIMITREKFAWIFTSSQDVIEAVDQMSYLLSFTILLNSVQPILSGVAVGCGWQARVAYVNLGCYYAVGLPLGVILGWVFDLGVKGIWGGMIFGGTAVQTVILAVITGRSDWDKEAMKAKNHVRRWTIEPPADDEAQLI
uniref:Protein DETOXIFICATION n=1 Tax=Kalanchoe fedtschenkoi TaxID=63787 RepID=A0A7N0ULU8_KALFE